MLRSTARGVSTLLAHHQGCLTAFEHAASSPPSTSQSIGFRSYIADPKIIYHDDPKYHEPSIADILFTDEDTGHTIAAHPGLKVDAHSYLLKNPVYTKEYAEQVKEMHKPITNWAQRMGYMSMCMTLGPLNRITGYSSRTKFTEKKWLNHLVFMESVLGCAGMVGAMLRHMHSLRSMERDHGWIHTLLEESENSRMHLLMFMQMAHPPLLTRICILLTQGFVFNVYLLSYIISPSMCHAYVGYMCEESVKTYTRLLKDVDSGKVFEKTPAPEIGVDYWKLDPATATIRDIVLAARADEACHAYVNHTFSELKPSDKNPFTAAGRMMQP